MDPFAPPTHLAFAFFTLAVGLGYAFFCFILLLQLLLLLIQHSFTLSCLGLRAALPRILAFATP